MYINLKLSISILFSFLIFSCGTYSNIPDEKSETNTSKQEPAIKQTFVKSLVIEVYKHEDKPIEFTVVNTIVKEGYFKGANQQVDFYDDHYHNLKKNNNLNLIWFHAASIGEFKSIVPIIKKLNDKRNDLEFLITTTTLRSVSYSIFLILSVFLSIF